jgi:subtilase family serine protease
MRFKIAASALLGVAIAAGSTTVGVSPAAASPAMPAAAQVCDAPAIPGFVSCFALRRTGTASAFTDSPPSGYSPDDLQSAYKLTNQGGVGATVAIIDAYDDPAAEADLAVYRSRYGLPPCTTANGCFRKVNQAGAASPLPQPSLMWAGEISLDVDMVSAVCPNCHILLVEANSNSFTNLFTAINKAVAMGAKYVSNSWGGSEFGDEDSMGAMYLNHPGVAITASTGDAGYRTSFPATSRYVTAVGGTSLNRASNARGWAESAWSGAGSGCSFLETKPVWQGTNGTCVTRAASDVSAVADPNTGVAVYQTYGYGSSGWVVDGGTSAAAPIVAAVYALAGTPGPTDYPAAYPYAHKANLFDVATGSNGSCPAPMCIAGTGWDGPTGLGSPNGTTAFTAGSTPTPAPSSVTVTPPGTQTGRTGTAANLTLHATGGSSTYTWTATGLPVGLTLARGTGVISGTPTAAGTASVQVTASSGTSNATATFDWTLTLPTPVVCTTAQLLGNGGFETVQPAGTAGPWVTTPNLMSPTSPAAPSHAGGRLGYFKGYATPHTDTATQTVTIPAACKNVTLTFWLRIDSTDPSTATHDTLTVKIDSTLLATYSNASHSGYALRTFNLATYSGKTVTLNFTGIQNTGLPTTFLLDDVQVNASK